jgi:hypothetical protein
MEAAMLHSFIAGAVYFVMVIAPFLLALITSDHF